MSTFVRTVQCPVLWVEFDLDLDLDRLALDLSSYRSVSTPCSLGRPQPDNREGGEVCLGVLKGIFNDGVVFHDINCSHRKAVICEA